jgi:hypothetical protein
MNPQALAPAAVRSPAGLRTSLTAQNTAQQSTEFWTVNGILVTPTGAAEYLSNTRSAVREAGLPDRVTFFYNKTFLYEDADKYLMGQCWTGLFTKIDFVSIILLPARIMECLALTVRDLLRFVADVGESARQVASIYLGFPIAGVSDARALSDSMRVSLDRSGTMIVIPHSQGNLMVQEALNRLRDRDPLLQNGATSCIGVVSLAAPVSGSYLANAWPTVHGSVLKRLVMRGDIILMLGLNGRFPLDTQLSREAERKINALKIGAWLTSPFTGGISLLAYKIYYLAQRGKLHLTTSYLDRRGARVAIKTALTSNYNTLSTLPGCTEVAAVEVSPATATILADATTQLSATTRDAAGNVLTGRMITWTSSDPSVVTVSAAGLVTGVATGTVTVTATSEGKSGTASVTVTGGAYLTGRVAHAEMRAGISGAMVTFSGGGITRSVTTSGDGSYTSPGLAAGTYQVTASAAGYVSVTLYSAVARSGQTTTLETIPLVPSSPYPGGISGSVRDARHNGAIPGAAVELRSGMNALEGALVASAIVDAYGNYRFTGLPAGTYSVLARAAGFVDGVQTGIVVGNKEISGQNVSLSPSTNNITIVLRWGATPSDLDSHLTGPTSSGTRFHVYYAAKGSLTSSPYAALDIDDVSSYGPETITISRQLSGVYRYSVHDYSNRWSNPSSGLANSGAQVKVYRGGALIGEFNVPNQPGTLWTVFEIEGEAIRPVNSLTYLSSPSSVQSKAPVPAGGRFGRVTTGGRRDSQSFSAAETDAAVIEKAVKENPKTP